MIWRIFNVLLKECIRDDYQILTNGEKHTQLFFLISNKLNLNTPYLHHFFSIKFDDFVKKDQKYSYFLKCWEM